MHLTHHKSPHFKCIIQQFLMCSQSSTSITTIKFQYFHCQRNKLPSPWQSFSISPVLTPRQPLIYFLTLWVCLIWTFHTNRIMQYVSFHFLSLSVFSKFIHIVVYTAFHYFLWLKSHCVDKPYFVYTPSVDGY